jgi:hypothetical protein
MIANDTPAVTNDVKSAKQNAVETLLRPNANIVGVGIGKKTVDGKLTDCVRVYVVAKLDPNNLSPKYFVPPCFLGVPTDVIEVGYFGRRGRAPKPIAQTPPSLGPGSRIRVKTDAPNVNEGSTGTLGAVVTDGATNYILSCNHILAVNGRVPKNAEVVSAEFVGNQDTIAAPGPFVPLDPDRANSADCAVAALPKDQTKVHAKFPDGLAVNPNGPIGPARDRKVAKFGAATFRTDGSVVDVDADLYIDYSFGTFRFEHQVMIDGGTGPDDFARNGDSGSIVVDTNTGQPTAMIFAASGRFAVACPLTTDSGTGVLDKLREQLKQPLRFVTG